MCVRRVLSTAWVLLFVAAPIFSQTIEFTSVPEGFKAGSIDLPAAFTGALGADPTDDTIVYASIGSFGDVQLARIDLKTGDVVVAAIGPFGSLGGIAVLSATQVVLVDNFAADGGPPVLLASDNNQDGDFNDAGEIEELIAPILVDGAFGFSGAQARVAPPGDPSGIPSGSVLYQTADDNGNAEILVIEDPLGTPTYRPVGAPYFTGFDFNGGFDFDSQGRILMGTATGAFTGNVIALVNENGDEDIDPGESHLVVSGAGLPSGKSDLSIDAEDDAYCASGSNIDFFRIPNNPLTETANPSNFASTDASFLTAVLINSKNRPFEPGSGPNGATLITGGFTGGEGPGRNLLTLTPEVDVDLNGDGVIDALDLYLFLGQWQTPTGP